MQRYDITFGDFNPEILYACKKKATENGKYHAHDIFEITYLMSGRCHYLVEGEQVELVGGDLLLCKPGTYHQYQLISQEEAPVEFYIGSRGFHFRGMGADEIVPKSGGYVMHCKAEMRQELNQLCYLMEAENQGAEPGRYFMQKAYLMQMLMIIFRENMEEHPQVQSGYVFKSNNKSYVVKRIISYLNENYEKKISLDQISHNMYLSPVYISKLFKEETGDSPINYLIKIRLEKAKVFLEEGNHKSIKTIASMVGYEDVYYFSKLFKKYYGIAPLHYRNHTIEKVKVKVEGE